jgi:hypothetical protein
VITVQNGDGLVIFLLVLVLGAWIYFYMKGRMREAVEAAGPIEWHAAEEVPEDEATQLLVASGYHVVSGKKRIPIQIVVNGQEELQSRLFLDYIAEKDEQYYAVKLAKDRKPMELTGSSVREHLFIYQLIVPHVNGVLYVQLHSKQVDVFEFHSEITDP